MIKLRSLICEAKVPKISLQQAVDNKLFGPVFHGTKQETLSKIDQDGFKVITGMYGSEGMAQGYDNRPYGGVGAPPPIHHLGFGVYFTTKMAIAKKFAGGTAKGMKTYYLNIPKHEIINWGSTNTMMKWWIKNGYDPELAKRGEVGRYKATLELTEKLKSHWDAVWYKGKGMFTLLDGDQVCVYEPEGKIFEIDFKLAKGFEVGAKVITKHDITYHNYQGEVYRHIPAGVKGIVLKRHEVEISRKNFPLYWAKRAEKYTLEVKFDKHGTHSVEDVDLAPINT